MLPVPGLWTYSLPVSSRGPVAGSRRAQPPGQLDNGQSCPWQDVRGHCTARDARPLGCRVFFCDPSFETHAPELSETFLARLKQLARRHDWPWNYAPLHQHLRQARALGRLKIAAAGSDIEPEGPFIAISDLSTSTAAARRKARRTNPAPLMRNRPQGLSSLLKSTSGVTSEVFFLDINPSCKYI